MSDITVHCHASPYDTLEVATRRPGGPGGIDVVARGKHSSPIVIVVKKADADRLADFLAAAGFGHRWKADLEANTVNWSSPDRGVGEESGVLKPSTSELTGGEMDSLYTTIENLIAGTASLAGKVAVLERRLNSAASEMRG